MLPILLLTGYLGAGKTTLLNRILANRRGIKFAVIVNDLGEVNIDADLIEKGGIVDKKDDSLVALQNGCICCTLKMDLVAQIDEIVAMNRFDYLVIEASGICEPAPIAQTICSIPFMNAEGDSVPRNLDDIPRLDCIATVVDALRLRDEFGCGSNLTEKNLLEDDIENLIIEQIEFCNLVLLNKASEVSQQELARITDVIRALNPGVEVLPCDYCDVPLDRLLDTKLFNFNRVATSATWIRELEKPVDEEDDHHDHGHHHHHDHNDDDHEDGHHHHHHHDDDHEDGHEHHHHHHHDHDHCHCHNHENGEAEEYGVQTFVYYRRDPFDLNRFDYFVGKEWPGNIIRAKGVCYFAENPDMSYIFEQAGSQKKLTESGQWYATAPADELAAFFEQDPGLRRDWKEPYGDRMQKIVIIGRKLDREAISALFDACLTPFNP